jgi:hypothetical protein
VTVRERSEREVVLTLKMSDFERRHALLLHQSVIAAAFLTYLVDPEDVVWRFIKNNPANRVLEHASFAVATLLVGVAALVCTRARALGYERVSGQQQEFALSGNWRERLFVGEFMYAVGLAALAPLRGSLILIGGEGIRICRLAQGGGAPSAAGSRRVGPLIATRLRWRGAFRREAFKWGVFLAMGVFTITLRDRLAEVLIAVASLVGFVLMVPALRDSGPNGDSRRRFRNDR